MIPAVPGTFADLLREDGTVVASIPVHAWSFIDGEGLPWVALVDRLKCLRPGIDNYELSSEEPNYVCD